LVNQKINNIQALRAFAAIAVAILHTKYALTPMPAVGAFGVDIFFVISGFIMARICETNSSFFFRRRLIRIVPPYWAMTLLLFLFAWKFPQLLQATQASGQELIKSLLFIPYYKSNGLLRPLLFVGWSLNYEMFFYVALAVALLILPKRPLLLTSLFIVTTVAISFPFAAKGAIPTFYSSGVMIEFLFGIIAYFVVRGVSIALSVRLRSLSLLFLLLSLIAVVLNEGFFAAANAWHRNIVTGLICFVMITSASLLSKGAWDINFPAVVLIGDASYMLYLLHPYCELLLDRIVARRMPIFAIDHLFGCVFALTVSIFVAVILHLKLERPVVAYLNKNFGGKRKSTEFVTTA
jgi:exopolysaccharide production protein ExoZ